MRDQIEKLIASVDNSDDWNEGPQCIYIHDNGYMEPPDPEAKKHEEKCKVVRGYVCREVKTLAGLLAKDEPDTAKRLFRLAPLIEDRVLYDSRLDHPCVQNLWATLKPELEVIAARSGAGSKNRQEDGRTNEERVQDYIEEKIKDGWSIHDFKRDDIAAETGISGGSVSKTKAWDHIVEQRDLDKLPPTTSSRYNTATSRKEWDEAARLAKEGYSPD